MGRKEEYPYHRKFIRHKIRVKVDVHTLESYVSWTNNLSEEGVCFEIPRHLPTGREVVVWLFISRQKSEQPVQARCRIVWNDKGKKTFQHGGTFLFFAGDGKERLQSYLTDMSRPLSQPPPP